MNGLILSQQARHGIKKYLTTCNISTYKSSILAEKRLLQSCGQEFVIFASEIQLGVGLPAKELLEQFRGNLDGFEAKNWTQKRFASALTMWAKSNGFLLETRRISRESIRETVYFLTEKK